MINDQAKALSSDTASSLGFFFCKNKERDGYNTEIIIFNQF